MNIATPRESATTGVPHLIAGEMAAMAGTLLIMQAQAGLVAQQNLINPEYFPKEQQAGAIRMQEHQISARQSANDVLNDLSGKIIGLISNISAVATEYETLTGSMETILEKDDISPEEETALLDFMENLYESGAKSESLARSLRNFSAALSSRIKNDADNFQTDYETLYSVLTGDKGRISEIYSDLDDIRLTQNTSITSIIIASLGIGFGAAMIAAGAIGSFSGTTGVIITGITAVVAAGTTISIASVELKSATQKAARLYQELASLNVTLAVSVVFAEQMASLQNTIQSLQTAVGNLDNTLQTITTELEDFRKEIRTALSAKEYQEALAILRRNKIVMDSIVEEERLIMSRLGGTPIISVSNLLELD